MSASAAILETNADNATVVLTPDGEGKLPSPGPGAVIPVSAYVEADLPSGVQTIEDIYGDPARTTDLNVEIVRQSRVLGDAINEIVTGSADRAAAPLTYDLAMQLAAVVADRALRLAAIGGGEREATLVPEHTIYRYHPVLRSDHWRVWQKTQSYQWLILRLLAGGDDMLIAPMPGLIRRLRVCAGKRRQDRIALRAGRGGIHSCYLARHEKIIAGLGFDFPNVPSLVNDHAVTRDEPARARIASATEEAFGPLLEACGLPASRATGIGRLMGSCYPESRLECRARNENFYARYFDRWPVEGLITATGQTWHDPAAYFWTECNRRELPSIVLQHGGQYGYDDKQPGFFALDQTLPTHFVSWGWERYSSAFDGLDRRAEIVPLPDARLSAAANGWSRDDKREKLLVVPLSKFRSLEVRFGSIACDGRLLDMRRRTAEIVKSSLADFDRIIITYRSADFDRDPLRELLCDGEDRIEIVSARETPASALFARASAVFWDVTATGPFESLTYRLPTVVLMRAGRWAADAHWAEKLFAEAGIGVYDAQTASERLMQFARDPDRWEEALASVQPALQAYARSSSDWKEQWSGFLAGIGKSGHA